MDRSSFRRHDKIPLPSHFTLIMPLKALNELVMKA